MRPGGSDGSFFFLAKWLWHGDWKGLNGEKLLFIGGWGHVTGSSISLGESAPSKVSTDRRYDVKNDQENVNQLWYYPVVKLKVRCEIKQPVHMLQQQKKHQFKKKTSA